MKKPNKDRLRVAAALAVPPIFVICFMLFIFRKNVMYPFGTRSLSWCDMSQQVVPLLNQFKDVLDGKSSMFLNLKNSGGMNFYGVFFFFLASPFTFLVKFVDKADMLMFANILVMLKMAVCAFTASCFFTFCRRKLDTPSAVLLSVMYPFCGYAMMYYQNVIWLDMMYLFPLLLIALTRVTKKQNCLMYIAVLSAMMIVNYYIGYMVVIFILLFTAVYIVMNRKSEYCSRICREIFIGSALSALLTAVVWLPSLIQYFGSGRGETTLYDSLSTSKFVTEYYTLLPMLFCTAFAAVAVSADIASGRKRSPRNKRMLTLLAFTLIPFVLEPINKMWHTGNYMSFPGRFGFMTIFLALVCTAYALEQPVGGTVTMPKYIIGSVISVAVISLSYIYVTAVRENNPDDITRYSHTLWGNDTSFRLLLGVFIMFLICYGTVYAVYRKGLIYKNIFLALSALIFLFESYGYCAIYMTDPAERNEDTNAAQSNIYDLADRIEDDDFYRVKSYAKVYNNNMIGAMGYNSISHYTSLNSKNYMYTMKRLGYSGVWMETSSVGGTRLTDALLSIKYEINGGAGSSEKIYESQYGRIERLPDYLPMGLLTEKNALDETSKIPEELSRAEVQSYISKAVFGEDLVTEYEHPETVRRSGDKRLFLKGETYSFKAEAKGETAIYLDCFDELTNHLSEPIFDAFSVKVNGVTTVSSYPTSLNNGVLYLGTYTDETVEVTLYCQKEIQCASFGLFGIDCGRLDELCAQAQGVNFTEDGGGLSGSCTLDGSRTCFVSLPYEKGFTVKVNGEKVKYSRAFSDFIRFDLQSGHNEIEISYIPSGFKTGLALTVIGAAATAVYIKFRKKLDKQLKADRAAKYVMLAVSAAAIAIVYVMPMIVNIIAAAKETAA